MLLADCSILQCCTDCLSFSQSHLLTDFILTSALAVAAHVVVSVVVSPASFEEVATRYLQRCVKKHDPIALNLATFEIGKGYTHPMFLFGPLSSAATRTKYEM